MTAMLALMALWGLGSAVALVLVLLDAGHVGRLELLGVPAWWAFAASVPASGYLFYHWYWRWRATGRQHGFVDQVLEPAGLRLVHPRPLGRTQQLLVERGHPVEIGAVLRHDRRAGRQRSYRFTVSTRDASFSFTQDVHLEKLSIAPLDEAAHGLRIEVVTSGAAIQLGRRWPDPRATG
jgi:hypothetical protein